MDMICHKIGRIMAGDPNHADHWADIAGYATLVQRAIEQPPADPGPQRGVASVGRSEAQVKQATRELE